MKDTTYILLRIDHENGEGLTSALECITAGARQSTDESGDPLPSLQCSGSFGSDEGGDLAQWETAISSDPSDISDAALGWFDHQPMSDEQARAILAQEGIDPDEAYDRLMARVNIEELRQELQMVLDQRDEARRDRDGLRQLWQEDEARGIERERKLAAERDEALRQNQELRESNEVCREVASDMVGLLPHSAEAYTAAQAELQQLRVVLSRVKGLITNWREREEHPDPPPPTIMEQHWTAGRRVQLARSADELEAALLEALELDADKADAIRAQWAEDDRAAAENEEQLYRELLALTGDEPTYDRHAHLRQVFARVVEERDAAQRRVASYERRWRWRKNLSRIVASQQKKRPR